MRKVLIITYYWPPGGGAGVQRWLKFVKYLRIYGWEPVVYTAENGEMPAYDQSLLRDVPDHLTVIKRPIWEPYDAYKKFIGRKPEDKINAGFLAEEKAPGLLENISVWIRGNLFIPDARRFWIRPSVKYLIRYLRENPVDAIVSTGPPHSMHLIASGVVKKLKLPWLADFRDPWTEIDFYKDLNLTLCADRKHKKLERKVLQSADAVVTISKSMAESAGKIYNREYFIVTNGYDPDDRAVENILPDKKFSIAHIGSMVKTRNPGTLWKVLSSICQTDVNFRNDLEIKLVGKVDYSVTESIKRHGLQNNLNKIDYLDHTEVVKVQQQSQVLLLMINDTPNVKMILPGKFFEYMAAGRPILCIGAEGDASELLRETGTGLFSDFYDEDSLRTNILKLYTMYKEGKLNITPQGTERFSRKVLTGKIAGILDEMTMLNKSEK